MLERTDKERLATLEADIPWIKKSLTRLERGQTALHGSIEAHLSHPVSGNGTGNGGVQIIIGKRALGLLASPSRSSRRSALAISSPVNLRFGKR